MKCYAPLITFILVYVAFVLVELYTGKFSPLHLFLYPLAVLAYFLPVWFFVHLLVSLFIKPWKEEDLNWLFLSIDIIISGVGATTVL